MNWSAIVFIIGGALLIFVAIYMIRNNPELFSKHHLGKSIYTLGLLTLMIIAVVAFLVIVLKN